MSELRMPSLGSDMEAGTLVSWRKQLGDTLHRGDIVAEVETQKGIIEIECFEDGVLERFLVEPGTQVPVGTPLAVLRVEGAPASAPVPARVPAPVTAPVTAPAAAPAVTPTVSPAPTATSAQRARISPAARKRAGELGVDLSALRGSGPEGAITLQDVERAASAVPDQAASAVPGKTASPQTPASTSDADRKRALRQAIAAAMTRSKREIPHYYLGTSIDLGTATLWLTERNAQRSVRGRVLPSALLLKAVARAARELPDFNAYFEGGEARILEHVHLGVAVALRGGGLVAPAIHDADTLTLDALMEKLQDLVTRARAGGLRASELSDGTLTVTQLGDRGVETVFPIIYPPQTAIVGIGRIVERPWVVDGALAVRPIVQATLAADHRVTDGHLGARFLARIDELLQKPSEL